MRTFLLLSNSELNKAIMPKISESKLKTVPVVEIEDVTIDLFAKKLAQSFMYVA